MKRKNKPQLAIENARVLFAKVDWEGDLLYVAQNWTFKEEFKDKKYESLRKALVKAAVDLEDYCGLHRVEEEAEEGEGDDSGVMENNGIDDYWDVTCKDCGDSLEKGKCGTCDDGD